MQSSQNDRFREDKKGETMNIMPEHEIIAEEEINLYDYWKILIKRKNVFLGIFLVPLVIVTIVSLSLPRYYRGESEITNLILPATKVVSLIGNIDDAKKNKIFANNSGAIKSVIISVPRKSTDKVSIIIDTKTADIISQASKDVFDYFSNLPEIQKEIARRKEGNDLKLNKFVEAKETNLIFLNYMKDVIKKRQLAFFYINPADLVKKDADLSQEIVNLQYAKVRVGILSLPSIAKQPSYAKIKQIIIITGILSLMAGIFVVFFLDYIERMKARENK